MITTTLKSRGAVKAPFLLMDKPLIGILGPTASGKTKLAIALAERINGAIISADSRQVYRGMDIGTGKDLDEYGAIPYYLIDTLTAGEQYSVSRFRQDFVDVFRKVVNSGRYPILCGGSGLYIQAVLQDYRFGQAEPAGGAALLSGHRLFGIDLPLVVRRERITHRLRLRLEAGLIAEVEGLLRAGIPAEQLIFYGLEYKYATLYLQGALDKEVFFIKLNTEIHRFAKRQMTYFRKMEKDGLRIHWLDGTLPAAENVVEILECVDRQ